MLLFLDREKIASFSTYREDEDATNKLRMKANAGLLFFKTQRERERERERERDKERMGQTDRGRRSAKIKDVR